jgi:hypothetical protein
LKQAGAIAVTLMVSITPILLSVFTAGKVKPKG